MVSRLAPFSAFGIRFTPHPDALRAVVTGASTYENTVLYWHAIVEEVERVRPRALLLVDELRGEPLTSRQWHALVAEMRGSALEGVRIAHVKPFGLSEVEHCEIFAMEAGFRAHVFDDERLAEIWLRYGEDEGDGTAAG